jgi:glutamate-1-semialdehyde 2,1-aminomutase
MSAGLATLKLIQEEGFYQQIEEKSAYLEKGLLQVCGNSSVATCFQRVGGMFCTFFQAGPVLSFADAVKSDTDLFSRFFRAMLDQGINLAPSQFEAGFMSVAHSQEDLDKTISAVEKSLASI